MLSYHRKDEQRITIPRGAEVTDEWNIERAKQSIRLGAEYPYDAPDAWWNGDEETEPPASTDAAHLAARAVVADLKDRRGIKNGFSNVDEDIRVEIVDRLAEIIRQAMSSGSQDREAR